MNSSDSSKQIKQMVNFIMQESHEKVNEIRIKTDHDFNLEKQNLVHSGKLKVQEEYAQKIKDLEIEQKVLRSSSIGAAKIKIMKARDELLEQLKTETIEELALFSSTPKYEDFLRRLIVQGLIKIEEDVVDIHICKDDEALTKKVLPLAIADYKLIMAQAGRTVKPSVTISSIRLPLKMSTGGLVLTALNGRIVVNQTVEERLAIAYTDMMPAVRHSLFKS